MNELIIKYISEEISEEEKQQLFSLLESDEEIRKEFLSSVKLRALTSWQPTDNDMSEGIDKLMAFKNRHAKKHRIIQLMRYAAVACIIILGSVAIFHKPHTIPYESANN